MDRIYKHNGDILDVGGIEKLKLKILVIGNSYSLDSFMYVPFILKNKGIDIELGVYYRSGGSLQNHCDEWSSNTRILEYIDTSRDNNWHSFSNYSPLKSVKYRPWDIVVFQQGSVPSVDSSTYEPYTRELLELVIGNIGKDFKLGWNININRLSSGSGQSIENSILQNIKNICDTEPVNIIFPYGTAIFNARTNETLDAIGDGGHLWASDQVHLQEGLPCYIASLANVQAIYDMFYPKYSVLGDMTRPTQSKIREWNIQGQQGTSVGVTEENCLLAQICAITANSNKFTIKTIL